MIVFNYKEESLGLGRGKVKRPVADVHLKSLSGSWVEFHPYIDSGADVTLIPLSLGKLLGFEVRDKKIQQMGGIRGSLPVIYIKNQIRIGHEEFPATIAWSLIENVPTLLGRAEVFDIFKVTFEQYAGNIVFDRR